MVDDRRSNKTKWARNKEKVFSGLFLICIKTRRFRTFWLLTFWLNFDNLLKKRGGVRKCSLLVTVTQLWNVALGSLVRHHTTPFPAFLNLHNKKIVLEPTYTENSYEQKQNNFEYLKIKTKWRITGRSLARFFIWLLIYEFISNKFKN